MEHNYPKWNGEIRLASNRSNRGYGLLAYLVNAAIGMSMGFVIVNWLTGGIGI